MSGAPVLEVEQLSKKFSRGLREALWYGARDIAGELTWWRRRPAPAPRRGEFWALREVSFALRPGESLGVIGGNGAGKSTLLKLMSGLLKPDAGRVRARGRVRAIIELGAAFNPVLTGRENIFAQAALYGYARRDVNRQLGAVVDFAAIDEFIDAPLQHYSSGMRARLGFAIAVHLSPEVLLVDEVLAVGDIAFQNKCLQFMRDYLARGGALVFVGHASHQVQAACERGLVLTRGEVSFAGDVVDALDFYFKQQAAPDAAIPPNAPNVTAAAVPRGDGEAGVRIDAVEIEAVDADVIATGGAARLTVRYASSRRIPDVTLGLAVFTQDGKTCVGGAIPPQRVTLEEGEHRLRCLLPRLPLQGGTYLLRAGLLDDSIAYPLAISGWDDAPHRFTVHEATTHLTNFRAMVGMHVGLEVQWETS